MTKENLRKRSKQQLGPDAHMELNESRGTLPRPEWSDRRRLGFWQPFNDWWRSELDRLGRRPSKEEIGCWYAENAYDLWKEDAPTLDETRVHAKCLRSIPLVRDYFRNYRARKRAIGERVGGNRQRRRVNGKHSQNPNMASGEEYDYRDDGDEGEDEGDEGEEIRDEDDVCGGHDADQHPDVAAADGSQGRYPVGRGLDVEGYLARDQATAAAAAAASLAQLATLRGAAGSASAPNFPAAAGGLPLELLHAGVSGVQSLLNPSTVSAAAFWTAAQHAAVVDAVQQSELLPGLALQQFQQAALQQQLQQHAQQQLALAAIAQNMALTRVARIPGIPGLPRRSAASPAQVQPQGALVSLSNPAADQHLYYEEQFKIKKEEDRRLIGMLSGQGEGEDEQDEHEDEESPGAIDFMEQVAQQAENLGRGKRKRGPGLLNRREDYEIDTLADGREAKDRDVNGTDTEMQAGPSGRGGSSSRSGVGRGSFRRGAVQPPTGRHRRTGKGAMSNGTAAGRQSANKKQPARAGMMNSSEAVGEAEDGREGDGARDGNGAITLDVPPDMLQVPLALRLDPIPRETLLELTHVELVERVLLLQAHVQLLGQQLEQQLTIAGASLPLAPDCRTPSLPLREQAQKQQQQQVWPVHNRAQQEEVPHSGLRPASEYDQTQQLRTLIKQDEQPTPMPTPARPDSSPAKAGPMSAASGSGCSPTEMQRSGSPVQGDDIREQMATGRQQQTRATNIGRQQSAPMQPQPQQQYRYQFQRRSGGELELLGPEEAAAISVLTGVNIVPFAQSPALQEGASSLPHAGGGGHVATRADIGPSDRHERTRSAGGRGLPNLIQALPQAAEA